MKSKLKLFFEIINNKAKKKHNLQSVLKKIAGSKRFNEILSRNTDWRNLPDEVAASLGITSNELLHKMAEKCKMPFLSRVPNINPEFLPEDIKVDDLRRLACVPRINNRQITAFICLDPARARMLFPHGITLPMAIAGWSSIKSALDESDAAIQAKFQEEEEKAALQALEAAKNALHMVLTQVKKYSIKELKVDFSNQKTISYHFVTQELKSAEGTIHNRVRNSLFSLLQAYSMEEESLLKLTEANKQNLKVRKNEVPGVFEVYIIDQSQSSEKKLFSKNVISFPELPKSESSVNTGEPREILIVDDSQVFAKVLDKFLAKSNITSRFASNGKEAIELIKNSEIKPKLVICDLHMPEMNGCEFVKRVREELKMEDLPIIILTSDNDVETELQLLTDGADAFISKSEDPRLLTIKVEKMLKNSQKKKAA